MCLSAKLSDNASNLHFRGTAVSPQGNSDNVFVCVQPDPNGPACSGITRTHMGSWPAEATRDATIAASQKNADYFTVAQARIKIEGSPYPGGGNFPDMVGATNAVMATGLNVSSVDFVRV
jgi:hypothetical protein